MSSRHWFQQFARTEVRKSRREWLVDSSTSAAATLLCLSDVDAQEAKVRRSVLVVGGGLAGAACAHELASAGYDVRVCEARSRVGGRVHTQSNWARGKPVELGGELIGANHPLWLAYAKRFGLSLLPLAEDSGVVPIRLDSKAYSGAAAKRLHAAMAHLHDQLAAKAKVVVPDQPWKSVGATELDRMPFSQFLADLDGTALGKRGVYVEFAHDLAAAPEKMSTLGVLTIIAAHGHAGYWRDTEAFRCGDGAQRLAEKLLEVVGPERVVTEQPVTRIEANDGRMKIATANGVTFEADDVVLTVPPSVWDAITFLPKLPAGVRPQMGTAVKYLAEVDRRFWKDAGVDSLGDDVLGITWEGVAGRDDEAAILASFCGGPFANDAHQMNRPSRLAYYRRAWETVAAGFGAHLVRDQSVDWRAETWTAGGYSCAAPGQVTSVWAALDAGMGRLHFAGEHAALGFSGFMEGALWSGARIAKRLAVRDGLIKETGKE